MHFFSLFGPNELVLAMVQGDWERVKAQCELHPHKAREWSVQKDFFDGVRDAHVLPLHIAVMAPNPPMDAIYYFIHAYPSAINTKETTYKRLPLHLACLNDDMTTELVRLLLSYSPDTARERDSLGRLPIHYACSHRASATTIDSLLRVDPRSASCRDNDGCLPIHVACSTGGSFLAIQRLLDAYPDSVVAETNDGKTPLQLVEGTDCGNKREIVSMLMGEEKDYTPTSRAAYSKRFHCGANAGPTRHAATTA